MSSTPTTRRDFLKNTGGVLAALALAQAMVRVQTPLPGELSPALRPAYPDPARTAAIDDWRQRIDDALVALESLWSYLGEVRSQAPEAVDGPRMVMLEKSALDKLETLAYDIETDDFGELVTAVTGRPDWPVYMEHYVRNGEGEREMYKKELADMVRSYPEEAAKLQALLDAHLPAAA